MAASNSSAAPDEGAPAHPLERLTAGGWVKGAIRLVVGVTVVTVVVLLTGDAVWLLGPAPAPMERRQGRYRAQLLVQSICSSKC